MQRTTRRSPDPRKRAGWRLAGMLLSALLAQAVHADAGLALSLGLVASSPHAPQEPADLRIEASWPNACLPVVERASMVPGHIDVHLRQTKDRCAADATPLDLRINPARASGWNQIPRDVYAVRLFLAAADGSESLIAFRWLDVSGRPVPATPESGFWWSVAGDHDAVPVLAGSGISLERQGERIAVTLFGYEAGRPEWAFGSGVLRGGVAHVQLVRMLGGAAPFTPGTAVPVAEAGPVLHLHFTSPAHAEAWIERDLSTGGLAIELQALELARSAFTAEHPGSAWQGRWVLVSSQRSDARVVTLGATSTSDAETFRLLDATGNAQLGCRLEEGPAAFPRACTLVLDGATMASFDRIGLDRLQGFDSGGEPVELVRLPD